MHRPTIVSVLVVFLLLLYIANLVVYEALIGIFTIAAVWQLWVLGLALGVLSGSFIVATIVGRYYYNWFTRWYYTVTSVWIGCFVYLFFASFLYGAAVGVARSEVPVLGMVLTALALATSVYGLLHARKIVVKDVSVTLPHLPEAWQGRKAIWMSDLHLGQLHGAPFAEKVVTKVNALPHDIIFIGGDLYDGTGAPDIDELTRPLRKLTAPLGSFFITGNHEEFGDNKKFLAAVRAAGIRTLVDEKVDIDGLQLVGVDYHNASSADGFRDILSKLSIDTQKPSILLKHEPKDLDVAEAAGISLQISGHTHRGQQWPLGYMAQLAYKGFVYGLKNFKTLQVLISSGTGTWGPPLRVGTDCEIVRITFKG